jgi:PhoPQ-activated pathogenicity-related protein
MRVFMSVSYPPILRPQNAIAEHSISSKLQPTEVSAMRTLKTLLPLLILGMAPLAAAKTPPSEVLDAYVARPQPAYTWKVKAVQAEGKDVDVYKIELVSQTWRGMNWTHRLNVIVPKAAEGKRARPGHALLGISGSGGEKEHIAILSLLARQTGVPVAVLHDVPNQPLFKGDSKNGKGLKEDALIAHTFKKFAETGDQEWPALLPMTRAVVSAMNCLDEFSQQKEREAQPWAYGRLEKFVTLGGSKRGWTTWLSAVVDERVVGIAPIVYDNLNIPQQIALHYDTFGKPSPSIHDYTERGLIKMLTSGSPRGAELLKIIDPYSYADRLTVPKMALIGTNDTYWPLESIHIYRGGLPGELFLHYVPNSGHRVGPSIIGAVAGFFDHVTKRIPTLPAVSMSIIPHKTARFAPESTDGAIQIKTVSLWSTKIKGRDFTKSKWTRDLAKRNGTDWVVGLPEACLEDVGRAAFIGELEVEDSGGQTFQIHTPVQVWELGPQQ